MHELTTWIDKNIKTIVSNETFIKYFSNIELENIEETYFLSNKLRGIDITLNENLIIESIFLSSGKYLDSDEFTDELPFDLKFSYNSLSVKRLMGLPSVTGGGIDNIVIGFINKWEKYFFDSFSIHIQYGKDENYIELITIGSLKFEEQVLSE